MRLDRARLGLSRTVFRVFGMSKLTRLDSRHMCSTTYLYTTITHRMHLFQFLAHCAAHYAQLLSTTIIKYMHCRFPRLYIYGERHSCIVTAAGSIVWYVVARGELDNISSSTVHHTLTSLPYHGLPHHRSSLLLPTEALVKLLPSQVSPFVSNILLDPAVVVVVVLLARV